MIKTAGICASIMALAVLAGCSSTATAKHVATSSTSVATVAPSTTTEAPTTEAPEAPACADVVGLLAKDVVDPKRGPQCITADSVADDNTGWGTLHCVDVKTGAKVTVYHWVSNDPAAPDTAEYVARSDGKVKVVPGRDAAQPAIVADLFVAVHCV
jgi:hypothetical protein